jgi:hypothetical protein
MQLLNLILFFLIVFIVFYLPGRLYLRVLGYKFNSFVITFTASLIVGISSFLFATYLLSWLKLDFLYNLVIPIAIILEGKSAMIEIKQKINIRKLRTSELLLVFAGTVVMTYLTWRSGNSQNGNLFFYGVNNSDSIFNLAIIGSLISNFPPFHPGIASIPLRGYHIFYDFLIAEFVKFYQFNVFDLFFRYFALLIALIYGLSSLSLATFLKWNKITALIFIFLMYFSQSFDYFAYYLFRFFNYYYNSAGITQSFAHALDPTIIISTGFVFMGFILLFSKGNKWSFLLPVLVIGVIPQIKIYSAIIFYVGFGMVTLWKLYKDRDLSFLKLFILSGIVSAIVFLPMNYGAGSLIFSPLLIYKNFIDSAWIFNNWHWNVNFPIYVQANNYIHIAFFYIVAIVIFLGTSLGIRVVILLGLRKVFSSKFYTDQNIFWSFSILVSFLVPSLFIQSSSIFQNIQFFWVGYNILLIPTAVLLGSYIPKNSKKGLILLFALLFILFFPDFLRIIKDYSFNPAAVPKSLVDKTELIKKIPTDEGIIVINRVKVKSRYEDLYSSPLIAGLSSHPIYYENEGTEFQGLDKIKGERKMVIDKIAENMVNCSNPITAEQNIVNVMRKTNNKYLLILEKNSCTAKLSNLKIVNDEGESILYKI